MKKVLFVATVVKSHIMVFHLPFIKWFKENGYETHVCAKNDYEDVNDCTIPYCDHYYDLPFSRSPFELRNIMVYKQLKDIIEFNDFDTIHCHTPMGGVLSRLAARRARGKGTSVIYTAHGFHFFEGAPMQNWLLYYPVERALARYTDVLITINREDYARATKFKSKYITYVPGVGIDMQKFRPNAVNSMQRRSEIGIPSEALVILSVGELNKNKNHEVVIRALSRLQDPAIYYVICGSGPLEGYLMKLAFRLGVGNQVKMLGFRRDVQDIYNIADIFAFLSFREGLSVSLMEAMASGLPVVASKIRGNTDLLSNSHGGYLYEPCNVEGVTEAITTLAGNVQLRIQMGTHNAKTVRKFSKEVVESAMVNIYSNISRNPRDKQSVPGTDE